MPGNPATRRSVKLDASATVHMKLLIVRHGKAGDREAFAATGQPDELRPLTAEGAREMKAIASALHAIVPRIDVIATSPLVRARQTAEAIAREYDLPVSETSVLEPDSAFAELEAWARRGARGNVTAIVGHEPHLSGLAAWLIGPAGDARLELKKGGACLLVFDALPERGSGTLRWLLAPGVIRRLRGD
jgi:phosphohistidine phosphatase